MTKVCLTCHIEKPLFDYNFRTDINKYRNVCKLCRSDEQKKWCLLNKSKISKNKREYYINNKDVILDKRKEYYVINKEDILSYKKEYVQKNRNILIDYHKNYRKVCKHKITLYNKKNITKLRAKCRKRRAMRHSVNEHYTSEDEKYTMELFGYKCINCGITENLTIDHHQPLVNGNPLTRQNAVVLCSSCNSSKNDTLPERFYKKEKLQEVNVLLGVLKLLPAHISQSAC